MFNEPISMDFTIDLSFHPKGIYFIKVIFSPNLPVRQAGGGEKEGLQIKSIPKTHLLFSVYLLHLPLQHKIFTT